MLAACALRSRCVRGRLASPLALTFLAVLVLALSARPAAAEEVYELKLATVAPAKTPWASLLQDYKTRVEKAAGGRLKVKIFLGGTLGDENATVRMTGRGQIQAVGASTGAVASLVPELDAIEVPFLFRNAQEADYVLDKFLLGPLEAQFRAKGLVLAFWSENGFRHFASTWGPIKSPADLKNRKVRSQESFVHLEMWKALQASAQAIPTTEVTTALKTGSVEGYDQALLYSIAAGWHTSIKYLTLSAHIYQPGVIAFNAEWFDKLPADLQKLLIDEGRALVRPGRAAIRQLNPKLVAIVKEAGVQIYTLTDAERAAFEKATRGVRDVVKGKSPAHRKILELIEQGLAEYRAKKKV